MFSVALVSICVNLPLCSSKMSNAIVMLEETWLLEVADKPGHRSFKSVFPFFLSRTVSDEQKSKVRAETNV